MCEQCLAVLVTNSLVTGPRREIVGNVWTAGDATALLTAMTSQTKISAVSAMVCARCKCAVSNMVCARCRCAVSTKIQIVAYGNNLAAFINCNLQNCNNLAVFIHCKIPYGGEFYKFAINWPFL
jgi:hypothetical protein